jgi:YVTN family beta-propeller protein
MSLERIHPLVVVSLLFAAACGGGNGVGVVPAASDVVDAGGAGATDASASARLPLVLVADVALPGASNRFDYQDIDTVRGHLVVAHMNDASVLVVDLADGSLLKLLPNIPTARGVAVASEAGRIFVTSSPDRLVIIDSGTLAEIARVATGRSPDGVGWDPVHEMVAVSDLVFDRSRARFWVTVEAADGPDQLIAIDPVTGAIASSIGLPGCEGAHGLRIHPDAQTAFVACEGNSLLARVDLEGTHAVVTAKTGDGPDVLSVDPGLGWLYVAAESGDLTVFDLAKPGLVMVDREHPGDNAHTVAVDPASHRVFFPLMSGPAGMPVLRIMRPSAP